MPSLVAPHPSPSPLFLTPLFLTPFPHLSPSPLTPFPYLNRTSPSLLSLTPHPFPLPLPHLSRTSLPHPSPLSLTSPAPLPHPSPLPLTPFPHLSRTSLPVPGGDRGAVHGRHDQPARPALPQGAPARLEMLFSACPGASTPTPVLPSLKVRLPAWKYPPCRPSRHTNPLRLLPLAHLPFHPIPSLPLPSPRPHTHPPRPPASGPSPNSPRASRPCRRRWLISITRGTRRRRPRRRGCCA